MIKQKFSVNILFAYAKKVGFLCLLLLFHTLQAQKIDFEKVFKTAEKQYEKIKSKSEDKHRIPFDKFIITLEDVYLEPSQYDSGTGEKLAPESKRGDEIAVNRLDGGIAIMNNSVDSVKLMMIKSSGETVEEQWLENGDFHSIKYINLETGNYTLFVSGKYGEVIKMLRIAKENT